MRADDGDSDASVATTTHHHHQQLRHWDLDQRDFHKEGRF